MGVVGGWAFSYERGTPVQADHNSPAHHRQRVQSDLPDLQHPYSCRVIFTPPAMPESTQPFLGRVRFSLPQLLKNTKVERPAPPQPPATRACQSRLPPPACSFPVSSNRLAEQPPPRFRVRPRHLLLAGRVLAPDHHQRDERRCQCHRHHLRLTLFTSGTTKCDVFAERCGQLRVGGVALGGRVLP